MSSPQGFVEEIDFRELHFVEVVGRGAFGVVSRAKWRGIDVAVKLIETETEKKAFRTELMSLSRVSHPNIVKLYGASTVHPVCLVMEYAEGGSLYNVLHGSGPQIPYSAAHAMSWCLQCAQGVEYLHNMKPKAIIHRDLKPPNLLLILGGTTLKICDFGTACDIQTHMTNNKGSAAWMAPEVFEGSNYSEKCDVFSWGIILWEVFTRKKPFDEIGGPAFRIMWAVHNGTRPPLIKNMPKPLEILMTRCWSAHAQERPSMSEVVRIMAHLMQFFHGAEKPLVYPEPEPASEEGAPVDTPPQTNVMQTVTGQDNKHTTIRDTLREALPHGEPVPVITPTTPKSKPVVVEDESGQRTSAPASLAASRENLMEKSSRSSTPSAEYKRYSADLSKLDEGDILGLPEGPSAPVRGHRRAGSHGSGMAFVSTSNNNQTFLLPPGDKPGSVEGGLGSLHHVSTAPATLGNLNQSGSNPTLDVTSAGNAMRSLSWAPEDGATGLFNGKPGQTYDPDRRWSYHGDPHYNTPPLLNPSVGTIPGLSPNDQAMLDAALFTIELEHQLQPLAPCPSSQESMAIYQEHCKLAQDYIRIQAEIALLTQRKHEYEKELRGEEDEQNGAKYVEEFANLTSEHESLVLLNNNLKKQVETLRKQQGIGVGRT